MDTTLDLLRCAPECQYIDEEEDEVFFGPIKTQKEIHGKNSKFVRRQTQVVTKNNSLVGKSEEESGFQEESAECHPGPDDPFESWFSSESDMLILYEIFGEFYDEEFEKLSYEEKKTIKDKVAVSVPKSPEELMKMYPEEQASMLSASSSSFHHRENEESFADQDDKSLLIPGSPQNASILSSSSFSSFRRLPQNAEEEEEGDFIPSSQEDNPDFGAWFEPVEELILFDLLGIDYRELFEAMTLEEKKELRLKVDNTEPKSKEEILAMLGDDDEKENDEEIPPCEISSPLLIKSAGKKEKSRRLTLIAQNPDAQPKRKPEDFVFKTPLRGQKDNNEKLRLIEMSPNVGTSPKLSSRRLPTGIDLSKVVSPVAQYIRSSPAPPLIRNIKPSSSSSKRFLSACTRENQIPSPPREEHFVPLPEASYKSSCIVTEQVLHESKPPLKSCFPSTESIEPKIIRHVGRVKVHKSHYGSENLENILPPDANTPGSAFKMTLKKNVRDSLAPLSNESMIDMSVHEIKTVQKLSDINI